MNNNNNNYYVCIVTNGINYYYRNDEIQFSIEDKNGNKHHVESTNIQPHIEYDYDIDIVCESKIKYNTYKLSNTDDVFDCPVCLDNSKRHKVIYNCGHSMCGRCDSNYFNSINNNNKTPTCHLCRSVITSINTYKF